MFDPVYTEEDLEVVSHSNDQRNKWNDVKPWKNELKYLNINFASTTFPALGGAPDTRYTVIGVQDRTQDLKTHKAKPLPTPEATSKKS